LPSKTTKVATCSSDIPPKNLREEYELLDLLGRGAFGVVFKARHLTTEHTTAVKILTIKSEEDLEIAEQEITLMRDCIHPNIVGLFGSNLYNDKLWICMEYCGGGSMQDILDRTGPLNEGQIAYVIRETLQGVHFLHASGRMHRDIKAANILLTNDGDVKLADFGTAALMTEGVDKRNTLIGTPYWMAPEIAAVYRKGGYKKNCDVWSVGITAIEFAEGLPPLIREAPIRATLLLSMSGYTPPQLRVRSKWTPRFHKFIKVALTKNPKRRPSAEKLLAHQFLSGNLSKAVVMNLIENIPMNLNEHASFIFSEQ